MSLAGSCRLLRPNRVTSHGFAERPACPPEYGTIPALGKRQVVAADAGTHNYQPAGLSLRDKEVALVLRLTDRRGRGTSGASIPTLRGMAKSRVLSRRQPADLLAAGHYPRAWAPTADRQGITVDDFLDQFRRKMEEAAERQREAARSAMDAEMQRAQQAEQQRETEREELAQYRRTFRLAEVLAAAARSKPVQGHDIVFGTTIRETYWFKPPEDIFTEALRGWKILTKETYHLGGDVAKDGRGGGGGVTTEGVALLETGGLYFFWASGRAEDAREVSIGGTSTHIANCDLSAKEPIPEELRKIGGVEALVDGLALFATKHRLALPP